MIMRIKMNSKTTRLNKTQKYAINWLNSLGKNSEDIAKDLRINQNVIQKYIDKNLQKTEDQPVISSYSKTNKKECVARFGKDKKDSKTLNMMVTETAGKRTKSVCIMTKEASSLSDKR